jgi:hypothetical protein
MNLKILIAVPMFAIWACGRQDASSNQSGGPGAKTPSARVDPASLVQPVACSCPGDAYPCFASTPQCAGRCAGSPGTAVCELMHYPLLVDRNQKILSRSGSRPPLDPDYDGLARASWEYMMNPGTSAGVPLCGQISATCEDPALPNYYVSSAVGANTHNPADMFATMVESSLAYYAYTGNSKSLDIAIAGLDFFLMHGLTAPTDRWSSVPYSAAAPMSVTYSGDPNGNGNGAGDGAQVIEPDKGAELARAYLLFYEQLLASDPTKAARYRDVSLNIARQLVKNADPTDPNGPWFFRLDPTTGLKKVYLNGSSNDYNASVLHALKLFDELLRVDALSGRGFLSPADRADLIRTRNSTWNWMKNGPMVAGSVPGWAPYFEDIPAGNSWVNITPLETAKYLLSTRGRTPQIGLFDPDWESDVRTLIAEVEANLVKDHHLEPGCPSPQCGKPDPFGVYQVMEQSFDFTPYVSHFARYAATNLLLAERSLNATAQERSLAFEKALRDLNYVTYALSADGSNSVDTGPTVSSEWFTDSHTDLVKHLIQAFGSAPEFAKDGVDSLLRSSSVVQRVSYGCAADSYVTFDNLEVNDVWRLPFNPALTGGVTSDGTRLPHFPGCAEPVSAGYTVCPIAGTTDSAVRIRHDGSTVVIATGRSACAPGGGDSNDGGLDAGGDAGNVGGPKPDDRLGAGATGCSGAGWTDPMLALVALGFGFWHRRRARG